MVDEDFILCKNNQLQKFCSEIKEYVDFFQNMYILLLWTMNLTVLCEPTKTWPIFKGNKEYDRKRRNAQEANKVPLMSSLWSDYKKIKQKYS